MKRDTAEDFRKGDGLPASPVPAGARTLDGADSHISRRILDATAEVISENGIRKLSLSDVALQAGVSRPTLYRWFASKEELIEAFAHYEKELFASGIAQAIAGLRGKERLDAALQFIVKFQRPRSGRLVTVQYDEVIPMIARNLPIMQRQLERLVPGPNSTLAAATATRVAVSHWVVRSDDEDQFLAQLRSAVGISPR